MVNQQHESVLAQILELLDTACQASLELLECHTSGELGAVQALLTDLRAVARTISSAQEPLLPFLEHAYTTEMLENVEDTLDDIQRSIEAGDQARAAMKMEFQLFPFLRQLKEAFYFWGTVYPDKERMDRYYQEEFAEHYQNFYINGKDGPRYHACIVVVAYNHLDMTKQCVESILKYTNFDKLNAELILVDHGSTEGVLEYFEGLGIGKVIHYKANMRGTMFCALPQLCDGKYYVHVANDTVVTKDWLDILLNCAESDQNIALAAPATCNMSNFQKVNVPVSDCRALIELAEKNNRSDPRLWNDRARVLPAIGLFRISALNEIGFFDPLFYTFDYMDDDFSLRARRHGYRQILCEDVMCYHKGSATVKDVHIAEDTLGKGQKLFLFKHGVDSWGTGFCYDYEALHQYHLTFVRPQSVNILGIDCGFGDTTLQIRNQLRREGQDAQIYHVTTDNSYVSDLQPHSSGTVSSQPNELLPTLETCFSGICFDIVFIGLNLESYPAPYQILDVLSRRMASGGQLVLFFSNPYFVVRLHQMLQFSIPDSPVRLLPPEQVATEARKYFTTVDLTGITQPIKGLDRFIVQHYGKEFLKGSQRKQLETAKYYVKSVK